MTKVLGLRGTEHVMALMLTLGIFAPMSGLHILGLPLLDIHTLGGFIPVTAEPAATLRDSNL